MGISMKADLVNQGGTSYHKDRKSQVRLDHPNHSRFVIISVILRILKIKTGLHV